MPPRRKDQSMQNLDKYTIEDYRTGAAKLLKAPPLEIGKKLGIGRAPSQPLMTIVGKHIANPEEQYNIVLYAQVARGKTVPGYLLMTTGLKDALKKFASEGKRDELLPHSNCVFKFCVLDGKHSIPMYGGDLEKTTSTASSRSSFTAASSSTMQPSSRATPRSGTASSAKQGSKSGSNSGRISNYMSK